MKTILLVLTFFLACSIGLLGQNNAPIAVNDTLTGFIGYPVYVTNSVLLQNDHDPDGDSIYVFNCLGFSHFNDSTWMITISEELSTAYTSILSSTYIIKDEHGSIGSARIVIKLRGIAHYDSANINNINALISPFGNHFWDGSHSHFEVPKGSGKQAMFSNSIWVGGLDSNENLHLAAERYRQVGADYFAGPISSTNDSNYLVKWNRVWKLSKTEIQFHINNWNVPGYIPIDAIKNWPAHGDVSLGQAANYAPFYDVDENGVYEPMQGDYPVIRGDQAVYFIYNDKKFIHSETKGRCIGIEIEGMAYEFDRPDDSILNNTLFMHYDIINRSDTAYHDVFIGLFNDFDLGYASDDYTGCDVTNGMAYCYNGSPVDGTGQSWAYGEHPPAIGMKVIGGPLLPADGIDNPAGACDYSINGLNFGDGVADNERMGMTDYIYTNNGAGGYMQDPQVAIEYYNLMKSIWLDGTHMIYGGNGHNLSGAVGPECNFMFPGNSDTICNWGTAGIPPNGGYNQNGLFWTESQVGNVPEDRRGIASIGPFNMNSGESIPLDFCYTFARDYSGTNNSSLALLRERVPAMNPNLSNLIRIPSSYTGIPENVSKYGFRVFPNPVNDKVYINLDGPEKRECNLFSIRGEFLSKSMLYPGPNTMDVSALTHGVYILQCGQHYVKVIKK
ncbi:MAG: hypothetical protein HXX13_03080 [Bacteroidetes bacterium]|nr:hypothetical protein [Bacteroidota bacterium]